VIVETTDGRRLEQIVPHSLGSGRNLMSADDLRRKFRENLAFGGLGPVADRVGEQIDGLDRGVLVKKVVDLCCRVVPASRG
jgi:hypothetical protein